MLDGNRKLQCPTWPPQPLDQAASSLSIEFWSYFIFIFTLRGVTTHGLEMSGCNPLVSLDVKRAEVDGRKRASV